VRVLFDTCVPQPLRKSLPGHTIKTEQYVGCAQKLQQAVNDKIGLENVSDKRESRPKMFRDEAAATSAACF
jgi:hypothetical protein